MRQYHGHPRGSIMNNIMDVHKLSINLDINRYIDVYRLRMCRLQMCRLRIYIHINVFMY